MNRPSCFGFGVVPNSKVCGSCLYTEGCDERMKMMSEKSELGERKIHETEDEYITRNRQAVGLGRKADSSKPRWSLLPEDTIADVIDVLEFGAKKYQVDNWQHVPDARTRYYDATMRHIEAWWRGEKNDVESGLHHLSHAVCCLLFLMWFDSKVDYDA